MNFLWSYQSSFARSVVELAFLIVPYYESANVKVHPEILDQSTYSNEKLHKKHIWQERFGRIMIRTNI